jgi:serine protease
MINNKLFLLVLLSVVAVSCERDSLSIKDSVSGEACAKILNTRSGETPKNCLLVKFEQVPQSFEELPGIISIQRVFAPVKGKEELEKKFGLDRWYICELDNNSDQEEIARKIATISTVNAVEYEMTYSKASDCKVIPCDSQPQGTLLTKTESSKAVFNDPYLSNQWHYINTGDRSVATDSYAGGDINVKDVWTKLTTGDESIIVAVVDEGVKYTHPDLEANMWSNPKETADGKDNDGNGYADDLHGWNFVADSQITWANTNDSGHGTHCAGTIAAVNNNNLGVCGVAGGDNGKGGVKIMSCQIFDGKAGGYSSIVAKAIKYAADNGASIISCSFGYTGGTYISDSEYLNGNGGRNTIEMDAIRYFEASKNNDVLDGGIAIFASGNDGDPYATYPGAYNDIISVSAFGPDYLPAYYTNYGPGCNIVAPGGEAYHSNSAGSKSSPNAYVLSTVPNELYSSDYGYMQGTSMACPHVTGVVALALSYAKKQNRHYTVAEFKNMIVTSANDFDTRLNNDKKLSGRTLELSKYYHRMGTGSIDAWRLMMKIEGTPCLTAATGEKQWLNLSDYFGTASVNLSYLDIEYDDTAAEAIGLAEQPYIKYGRLYIHPTKCGSAKFRINAVGGGTEIGGENAIGGMAIHQDVSVIVRQQKSENGGWL